LEAAAATLAAGVDYLGAGTVEFLLAPDGRFTFLEMNTRIQVEHGVTELLTGIDLVAAQLALAAGAPLPPRPTLRGHAIEVRVCAEDPRSAFAPAPGHLTRLRFPAGPGVRVDTGFEAGDSLPAEYDSLVAKVMALAEDRASAVARLARALDEVEIVGVPTTAGLLRAVLDSAEFRAGTVHTRWLEPWTAARPPEPDALARAAAAWVVAAGATGARATVRPAEASPWATLGAWR
jgi:acetyl/propionyl-CoA carboxylase alpha subunit